MHRFEGSRPRQTRIVATIGPCRDHDYPTYLQRLCEAGVDVLRLNMSHADAGYAKEREVLAWANRPFDNHHSPQVAVMADLQGPKIRIGRFQQGKIVLARGDEFTLDAERETGDQDGVGLDYKELPQDVRPGDTLLLDDGRIVFEVIEVAGTRVRCKVIHGGELSNNKGINRKGGGLTAPYYSHHWPGHPSTHPHPLLFCGDGSHTPQRTSEPSYSSTRGHPLPRLPRLRVVPFLGLAAVHRPGALGAAW